MSLHFANDVIQVISSFLPMHEAHNLCKKYMQKVELKEFIVQTLRTRRLRAHSLNTRYHEFKSDPYDFLMRLAFQCNVRTRETTRRFAKIWMSVYNEYQFEYMFFHLITLGGFSQNIVSMHVEECTQEELLDLFGWFYLSYREMRCPSTGFIFLFVKHYRGDWYATPVSQKVLGMFEPRAYVAHEETCLIFLLVIRFGREDVTAVQLRYLPPSIILQHTNIFCASHLVETRRLILQINQGHFLYRDLCKHLLQQPRTLYEGVTQSRDSYFYGSVALMSFIVSLVLILLFIGMKFGHKE